MSDGRSLTRREFDAVIRRAAELASSDPDGGESALTESELFRIAGEVGLDEVHVRRALAEIRSGVEGGGLVDRMFGPAFVRASRVVPGKPDGLSLSVDEFLVASRLLQRVRRGPNTLQYRPAVDWASHLARAASLSSRKYYIASARSVEVHFEAVDPDRTYVEFLVDPGTRGNNLAGAIIGGGTGGAVLGVASGIGLATFAPVVLAVGVGVVVGGGTLSGITYATGLSRKRKLSEVHAEIEGVLDSLECGASLEPPPSSWRRWVKRQFHGVARDLMRDDLGEER
jgi:hypothetical protein